jgi:eukaryotic-like serine/threonine-protein kinase
MAKHRPADVSTVRYHAFVSYSHADSAWAAWLHKALETYRVPSRLVGTKTGAGVIPRRLVPIFRDRDELSSSADLSSRVNEALQRSDNLIVICSPQAAASRWVNEEVLAFKRLGREARIFCLITDGEPNASDQPGRGAEECFVPALRYHLGPDGALSDRRAEPIAADVRQGKDGRARAKLKLIAGLLDVGFDTLRQREQQRRMRRMAIVTASALAVMLMTSMLALEAVISRHEAVVAQQAAERRQKQAEALISFMLGDLTDKLSQVSRLDILEAVDDKAMAYFKSLPTADVTDKALAQRVTALQDIGTVRENRGKLAKALESYRAASALAGELLRHEPENAIRQAEYANSLNWIGRVYWFQGDLPSAAQKFRAASTLLRKAVRKRPSDIKLIHQLSSALINTGRVLEARGDFKAAKHYYESARDNFAVLRNREPANAKWPLQLAYAYNDLGKLALEQGQLDQAIAGYRADQQLMASLAARDKDDRNVQEGLLISNAILGRTLAMCGELKMAEHFNGLAVTSIRKLTAFDPANKTWRYILALYIQQRGDLLREQGQHDHAAAAYGEALSLLSGLVASNPTNTSWQQELALTQLEQARLRLVRDHVDAAASVAETAQAAIQRLRKKNPGNYSLASLASQADLVLGQIMAKRHDAAGARQYWVRALETIRPATRSGGNPVFLAVYAEALLWLDQVDTARPVLAKLNAMGYRTPDFVALLATKDIAYPANAEFLRRIAHIMNNDAAKPIHSTKLAEGQ